MGKKRRKLMSPKYASKCATIRAHVAALKVAANPSPVVEEKVVAIAVPEPAATPIAVEPEPAPVVKKAPARRTTKRTTTKRTSTKKTPTKRTSTRRTKRTTVKKDQ